MLLQVNLFAFFKTILEPESDTQSWISGPQPESGKHVLSNIT